MKIYLLLWHGCSVRPWNMRKSLVYISQSILLQWNHVCSPSEIWLHATTKPNDFRYWLPFSIDSMLRMWNVYTYIPNTKNIMSSIHLTSAHRKVHVTPLTTLKPICVRFAFNDSKPATSDKHAHCTTTDKRNSIWSNARKSIHKFKPSNDGIFLSPPRDSHTKIQCSIWRWHFQHIIFPST